MNCHSTDLSKKHVNPRISFQNIETFKNQPSSSPDLANLVCPPIYLHFPITLSPIYKPLSQLGILILSKRTRSIRKTNKNLVQEISSITNDQLTRFHCWVHLNQAKSDLPVQTVCWFLLISLLLSLTIFLKPEPFQEWTLWRESQGRSRKS